MFWKRGKREAPGSVAAEAPAPPRGVDLVLLYHERTKHQPHRYARALGYMDWDTQPDPFRRYEGAETRLLDEVESTPEPSFDDMFNPERQAPRALDGSFLSQLLYDSLAISAWKEFKESRWSLRVNPSSGNLHPTEGYLLSGSVPGVCEGPALHHYSPYLHALERRRAIPEELWDGLVAGLGSPLLLVGLSSIYWRESWKYGERAFRYCQHDVGHAIGAVTLAASLLGWDARLLDAITDDALRILLGIQDQEGIEAEQPDALIVLWPAGSAPPAPTFAPTLESIARMRALPLHGAPRPLSNDHHDWPIIDAVSEAATKNDAPPAGYFDPAPAPSTPPVASYGSRVSARQMIRQRRSAVSMDGKTAIPRATFLQMMARVLPGRTPFAVLPFRPRIDLLLFVHRVDDLAPGVYLLLREPARLSEFREATAERFVWQRAPEDLPLYLLETGDVRGAARSSSCGQDIASDGAFAVAMLGHYEPSLRSVGPWLYKRLHWEAGLVGQVLYLDAEAAGIRCTGIGCFFDDVVHEMLGLRDRRFQTIYHFTVGGPVDDPRLGTLAAYAHRGV